MRKMWKKHVAMLLTTALVIGLVPVQAKAEKATDAKIKMVKDLENSNEEEKYAEGEAIILYNTADASVAKSAAKSVSSSIGSVGQVIDRRVGCEVK